MFLVKLWRATLLVLHLFGGFGILYGNRNDPLHPDMRATMRRWFERMLRILNVELTVVGDIPHESTRPVIMIANHISWVDIPLIGSLTPVNFLSKAEVASWPIVGSMAVKLGTLFITRGSGDTDHVMQAMSSHLSQQRSVLFFPEGTTTDGSKLRRFHKKLFKVCDSTEVVVCPVLIHYSAEGEPNRVPFVGDIGFGTHFWQMLGQKRIKARVEVLPQVQLDPEHVGHQIREVELQMRERLAHHNGALPN